MNDIKFFENFNKEDDIDKKINAFLKLFFDGIISNNEMVLYQIMNLKIFLKY